MKTGHLIDAVRRHAFDVVLDGDRIALRPLYPDSRLPTAIVEQVRQHKAELVALLASLPTFSIEEERALVDAYCAAPRAARLAAYRRGRELHATGLPYREADLQAMVEHFGK